MEQLFTADIALSQHFTLSSESVWWRWARIVAHLGDGPNVFGGLGLLYLLSWLLPDAVLRQATLLIALSVLLTMGVVTSIKYSVRRERPRPPGEFVKLKYDIYSFPSGHSARMAALTVGVVYYYPFPGWILVAVTLSVSAARVAVGVHYVSDVIVGLGVGIIVALVSRPLAVYIL